jgi:predicted Ser/Thr protein kinase
MEDLTGREFGPYRIVAPLGEGGMAAVYKAYQANMDRYVALKVLPRHFASDPQFVARFEQEAKVLAKLRHPHILPVHDYGESDGYTYLVMPFIESGALINLLRGEPLPLSKIEKFIHQVGDALDYAHSQGIIHRDVKPSNVLVDERENCMLVDFGIAKIVEGTANLTQTGGILGTPAYMSPEQGRGEAVDHRIDIYALGVILYEMATGRVPFKAETPIAVLVKHMTDPLSPPRKVNPDLPPAVEQVILKAMAKNPADRFATAGELVAALSAAVSNSPAPEPMTADRTVAAKKKPTLAAAPDKTEGLSAKAQPRYVWLLGAAGVGALILLLIGCGVLFWGLGGLSQSTETTTGAATVQGLGAPDPTATIPSTDTPNPDELTGTSDDLPAEGDRRPTATSAQAAPTPTPPLQPTATPVPAPGPASVVLSFGEEGIGPGLFTDARSVAVDNNTGHIYVGEYIGGRVQVFDETGRFITQWMVDPEMPLRGMDTDRVGNVYVVQSGLINKYNGETGELLGEINYEPGWGFDDVVVAADGGFVAPWSGRYDDIVRFNAQGEPALTITQAVSGQTNSSELETRVAVDGLGNIYALGTFNSAVLKFGPDGKFLDMFGSGGEGPGTLDSPTAIAVDGQGRIYVSELVGPIKIFDSGGQYLDSINIQALGMRFNDQGNLFVAARTRVVKYEVNLP